MRRAGGKGAAKEAEGAVVSAKQSERQSGQERQSVELGGGARRAKRRAGEFTGACMWTRRMRRWSDVIRLGCRVPGAASFLKAPSPDHGCKVRLTSQSRHICTVAVIRAE